MGMLEQFDYITLNSHLHEEFSKCSQITDVLTSSPFSVLSFSG